MNKIVLLRVLRSFITLMIGGGVIGFLHDKDILLAFILLLLLVFNLKKEIDIEKSKETTIILLLGTLVSAVLGVLVNYGGLKMNIGCITIYLPLEIFLFGFQ